MESLQFAACLLSAISLLLLVIALATDYWVVAPEGDIHTGLWRVCIENSCTSIGIKVFSYIHATRAFMLMGMIAAAVSFTGFCASFSHPHIGSISLKRFTMWASLGAGVCSMIAMSSFTGVYSDYTLIRGEIPFGWSFAIGWASVPLFLVTGGVAYKMVSSTT